MKLFWFAPLTWAQLKGESSTGEMRFPSLPIFKSSLQVILFFGYFPQLHFLFVLHERAHSLSPCQVYHFPLLLLNASYPNGMFSEFLPFTGLSRGPGQTHRPRTPGCLHAPCNWICRMKEGSRSHCDPRIPDSSHHEQTPRDPQACPSVPIKTAAAAAEPDGAKCKSRRSPVLLRWHSHQGCEGCPLTKQWMFLIPSNTCLGGYRRSFKPQVDLTCQSQIQDTAVWIAKTGKTKLS